VQEHDGRTAMTVSLHVHRPGPDGDAQQIGVDGTSSEMVKCRRGRGGRAFREASSPDAAARSSHPGMNAGGAPWRLPGGPSRHKERLPGYVTKAILHQSA